VAVREVTDSRLVSESTDRDRVSRSADRSDIGATGMQFILASWATLYTGLWLVIAPFALT
jgi:hypothetical protein